MPDVLGWRAKFGVLAPSTNTVVEPDFARMGVPGVTAHFGRIHIRDQNMSDDAGMGRLLDQIRTELVATCERVLTCEPDYMVMGMSAETFWGGVEGNRRFVRQIQEATGLEVATGAEACRRGLELYGAKRIGVVTPYQPVGDENVVRFFGELGFEVKAIRGLRCPTAVSIAHVTESDLRAALLEVDGDGIDALVQCGTNLSMVRLADEAERWLGKPVLAINAATWWMALRDNGIGDRVEGVGGLLRDH
ncbi:arylmalonate decarboxylase [Nocardia sp. CDC153]|uniref:maleate cis-trans isomerase family protein n=1 Tax=Nocardia sp. CDC153 TaxID=3112167 RepID=UPI002DB5F160|nr:arylmalonate decarboxylase [Nocardia sp. CDC153]MEC3957740.1 arylmalonate decarboxylase [Nocardia sp. CDC153]